VEQETEKPLMDQRSSSSTSGSDSQSSEDSTKVVEEIASTSEKNMFQSI
jgi:hypothetical protein